MLSEKINVIKDKFELYKNDIFTAGIIVLTAVIGFGLGRLSIIYGQKTPVKIEYSNSDSENSEKNQSAAVSEALEVKPSNKEKMYVASKNSDKYHLPWCAGAQRIKEENKIWFASKEEAEKTGYKPAENCEGI
ncbi:MAG: hypothetical protein AAB771_01805 [Patescibacteria group bacterium]